MQFRTVSVIGLVVFIGLLFTVQCTGAGPPYVKEGAPTEITFEEDGSYDDLNQYNVFADDDPEDDNLSFSSFDVEGLDISIDPTSGDVKITGDEDWNGQQEVLFRAMDGRGYFADHGINVTVIPVNDPPEPLGKIPREIWSEGDAHHFNVSQYFTDVDNDVLYYYAEPEPDAFSFVNADNDNRNPRFDIIPIDTMFYGYIQVVFTAYDLDPETYPDAALSAKLTAVFEVENVNSRPEVIGFSPQASTITIKEMESVNFSIDSVIDQDSDIFKCRWAVDGVVFWDHSELVFQYPIDPSYATQGTFIITVDVMDNLGGTAHNNPSWTLIVENVNRLPEVELVIEQTSVAYKHNITLNATGSDPDGDELEYHWYKRTGGNRTKWIGEGQTYVHEKDLSPGNHYFKCEVADGNDTVSSEWMMVTVDEIETSVPVGLIITLALVVISTLAIHFLMRHGHSKAY